MKNGDVFGIGLVVGVFIMAAIVFAVVRPVEKQRTICELRYELAETAADTVQVVAEFSECARYLGEDGE